MPFLIGMWDDVEMGEGLVGVLGRIPNNLPTEPCRLTPTTSSGSCGTRSELFSGKSQRFCCFQTVQTTRGLGTSRSQDSPTSETTEAAAGCEVLCETQVNLAQMSR
jgi:hypothetical protein